MKIAALIEFFIHPSYAKNPEQHRKARLFVRACLLTSLFSNSYIWLSLFFEFPRGVNLMIFNVIGFLLLTFLAKTRIAITLLGNLYVLIGAIAVIALTYYSGGMWSAIYPWIISIPVLALLVVNKKSGIVWAVLSYLVMMWFGIKATQGVDFPVEYNIDLKTMWFVSVLPGLLLIIMVVSLVFESVQTKALKALEEKNQLLLSQSETIVNQSSELKKLVEDKDHIIRILAHDLKNPLANITTISNLLEKEKDLIEQKKYVNMINKVSSNAQSLIDRVLEMALLDQGDLKPNMEQVDLLNAVEQTIESIRETARKKEIEIELVKEMDSCKINVDKTYLIQIMENLLSNAIKFSEKGKKIMVGLSADHYKARIKVMDEGPGIQPDEEHLLFRKFSKLSPKPTDGESSTGLGLSLTRQYVELMNGKIWYEKNEPHGSSFSVSLTRV